MMDSGEWPPPGAIYAQGDNLPVEEFVLPKVPRWRLYRRWRRRRFLRARPHYGMAADRGIDTKCAPGFSMLAATRPCCEACGRWEIDHSSDHPFHPGVVGCAWSAGHATSDGYIPPRCGVCFACRGAR